MTNSHSVARSFFDGAVLRYPKTVIIFVLAATAPLRILSFWRMMKTFGMLVSLILVTENRTFWF